MTDSISRLNYYQNQKLSAKELALEQRYHLELFRQRNQGMIRAGIAHGLFVLRPEANLVQITPGLAIDGLGNLLFLAETQIFDLQDYDQGLYYIVIEHQEQPTLLSDQTGTPGYKRVLLQPRIQLLTRVTQPQLQILLGLASNSGDASVDQMQNSVGSQRRSQIGLNVTQLEFLTSESDQSTGAFIRLSESADGQKQLLLEAEKLKLNGFFSTAHEVLIGDRDKTTSLSITNNLLEINSPPPEQVLPGDGNQEQPIASDDVVFLENEDGTQTRYKISEDEVTQLEGGNSQSYNLLKARVLDLLDHERNAVLELWDNGLILLGCKSEDDASEAALSSQGSLDGDELDRPEQQTSAPTLKQFLAHPSIMTLQSNGYVGIGTLAPTAELEVRGAVSAIAFQGDGAQLQGVTGLWSPVESVSLNRPNLFSIRRDALTGATQRDSNIYELDGWVGIGLSDPSAELHVVGFQPVTATGTLSSNPQSLDLWGSNTNFESEVAVGNLILVGNLSGDDPSLLQEKTVVKINSDESLELGEAFDPPLTDSLFQLLQPIARFFQPAAIGNGVPAMALMPQDCVGINMIDPQYALDVNGTIATQDLKVTELTGDQLTIYNSVTIGTTPDTIYLDGASGAISTDNLVLSDIEGTPTTPASLNVGQAAVTLQSGELSAANLALDTSLSVGGDSSKSLIQASGLSSSQLQLGSSLTIGSSALQIATLLDDGINCPTASVSTQLQAGSVTFDAATATLTAVTLTQSTSSSDLFELSQSSFTANQSVQFFGEPVEINTGVVYAAPCDGYLVGCLYGAIQLGNQSESTDIPLYYLNVTTSSKSFLGITYDTEVHYNYYPRSFLLPVKMGSYFVASLSSQSGSLQSCLWVPWGKSGMPPLYSASQVNPPEIPIVTAPTANVSLEPAQAVVADVTQYSESLQGYLKGQFQVLQGLYSQPASNQNAPPAGRASGRVQAKPTPSQVESETASRLQTVLSNTFASSVTTQLNLLFQNLAKYSSNSADSMKKMQAELPTILTNLANSPSSIAGQNWQTALTQTGQNLLQAAFNQIQQSPSTVDLAPLATQTIDAFNSEITALLVKQSVVSQMINTTTDTLEQADQQGATA